MADKITTGNIYTDPVGNNLVVVDPNKVVIGGKVKDRLGQERSCPTWEYPEDRDNFIITFNGNEAPQEIENAEN